MTEGGCDNDQPASDLLSDRLPEPLANEERDLCCRRPTQEFGCELDTRRVVRWRIDPDEHPLQPHLSVAFGRFGGRQERMDPNSDVVHGRRTGKGQRVGPHGRPSNRECRLRTGAFVSLPEPHIGSSFHRQQILGVHLPRQRSRVARSAVGVTFGGCRQIMWLGVGRSP